jgi:hypothetical protein
MQRPMKSLSLAGARDGLKSWQERSREPGLTALLVIEVVLLFVAIPLAGMGVAPRGTLPVMFVLFVVMTLIVTSRSRVAVIVVLFSAALSPLGVFIEAMHPSIFTEWIGAGGRIVALLALSWVIGRAVFSRGRVTPHRIQGAIVLYLNCAIFFFALYQLINLLDPNAFNGLSQGPNEQGSGAGLLYFSFSTLTTAGFGDISPVNPIARNMANLESVIGALYPATLIARLIGLEAEHRRG